MDYAHHYNRLIERAQNRVIETYTERHHIIPRCLGGNDGPDNIVRLTAEEHYVAHQLLVKMHPDDHRLLWALSSMTHATKRMKRSLNKRYGWLRRRFATAMIDRFAGKPLSAEHRAKLSEAAKRRKRRPHSDEAKAKMSAAAKGVKKSPEHVAAMKAAKTGKKFGPRSEEWRRSISEGQRKTLHLRDFSHTQVPEYRAKQSARMKEIWAERKRTKLEANAS